MASNLAAAQAQFSMDKGQHSNRINLPDAVDFAYTTMSGDDWHTHWYLDTHKNVFVRQMFVVHASGELVSYKRSEYTRD